MHHNITLDTLLKFAYNETGLTETALVARAIKKDPEMTEYKALQQVIGCIEKAQLDPERKTVDAILHYSRMLTSA
jgi:hypothetical protein